MKPRASPLRPRRLASSLAGCGDGAAPAARRRPRRGRIVLPPAYVAERVVGDHADVVQPDRPGGRSRTTSSSPSRQTAEVAGADVVVYERLPARGRRGGRAERPRTRSSRPPTSSTSHPSTRRPTRTSPRRTTTSTPPPRTTRTSGSTPCASPTVADAVESSWPRPTPTTPRTTRPTPTPAGTDLDALDRAYAAGSRTASATRSWSATTRSATWRSTACTSSRSPASPPTPSRPRRTSPSCRTLIGQAASPRSSPRRWPAPRWPRTLARDLGIETAVLDPIEGLADETAGRGLPFAHAREPRGPAGSERMPMSDGAQRVTRPTTTGRWSPTSTTARSSSAAGRSCAAST